MRNVQLCVTPLKNRSPGKLERYSNFQAVAGNFFRFKKRVIVCMQIVPFAFDGIQTLCARSSSARWELLSDQKHFHETILYLAVKRTRHDINTQQRLLSLLNLSLFRTKVIIVSANRETGSENEAKKLLSHL